jgi:hypothetical protein
MLEQVFGGPSLRLSKLQPSWWGQSVQGEGESYESLWNKVGLGVDCEVGLESPNSLETHEHEGFDSDWNVHHPGAATADLYFPRE